jgi:hypothetical protein
LPVKNKTQKKPVFTVALFTLFIVTIAVFGEEIIKMSTLETLAKEKKEFSIERDIFSPFKRKIPKPGESAERVIQPPPVIQPMETKKDDGPAEYDFEAEVRESVVYEGYVIREARKLALLSINGEFFVVGIDDIVLEKVKILDVEKTQITVEVESNKFEIQLKEDENNEVQQ